MKYQEVTLGQLEQIKLEANSGCEVSQAQLEEMTKYFLNDDATEDVANSEKEEHQILSTLIHNIRTTISAKSALTEEEQLKAIDCDVTNAIIDLNNYNLQVSKKVLEKVKAALHEHKNFQKVLTDINW